MKRLPTKLDGLMWFALESASEKNVDSPDCFPDRRGDYCVVWNFDKLQQLGMPDFGQIKQVARAYSQIGVIRGIHAEPWEKLIHVSSGSVHAVIVDLRPDSATLGQYECFSLWDNTILYVPRGFGNSYQVIRHAYYWYVANGVWSPTVQYTMVNYQDPDLAIPWPIKDPQIVSDKDKTHPTMRQVFPHWHPVGS